jgi:tRNA (cytidine/uridine-2'-O-)-methyltransferase
VLVEPEIPQNTGNIGRLAAALGCPLHLVGPLGFRIDEKAVRRAGLDYWHLVEVHRHDDLDAFRRAHPDAGLRLFSAVASRSYYEAVFEPGDALVFGRESVGLPEALLEEQASRSYAIPTIARRVGGDRAAPSAMPTEGQSEPAPEGVRSLNLANAVALVAYEAMRQLGAFDHLTLRP